MYNYHQAVKEDLKEYIVDEKLDELKEAYEFMSTKEAFRDKLYDDVFCQDSVTGNASGSYTFNAYRSKEYITQSEDGEELLEEAINEYCIEATTLAEKMFDYEWQDVIIRCYVLGEVLDDAINEVIKERGLG